MVVLLPGSRDSSVLLQLLLLFAFRESCSLMIHEPFRVHEGKALVACQEQPCVQLVCIYSHTMLSECIYVYIRSRKLATPRDRAVSSTSYSRSSDRTPEAAHQAEH